MFEDFKETADLFTQSFQNNNSKQPQGKGTSATTNDFNFKSWDEIDEDKLSNAKAIERKLEEASQPMSEGKPFTLSFLNLN